MGPGHRGEKSRRYLRGVCEGLVVEPREFRDRLEGFFVRDHAVAATSILCSRSSSFCSSATASRVEARSCTSRVSLSEISDSAFETSSPNPEIFCTTPSTVTPSTDCRISASRNRADSSALASADSRADSACSCMSANSCCTSALVRRPRTGGLDVFTGIIDCPFRIGSLPLADRLRYDRSISIDWKGNLRVVLVATRNPLNMGAAARAMANFGFSHLHVVNPYDVAFREARSAVGAAPLLRAAEEFSTVAAAVADCRLVVDRKSDVEGNGGE